MLRLTGPDDGIRIKRCAGTLHRDGSVDMRVEERQDGTTPALRCMLEHGHGGRHEHYEAVADGTKLHRWTDNRSMAELPPVAAALESQRT